MRITEWELANKSFGTFGFSFFIEKKNKSGKENIETARQHFIFGCITDWIGILYGSISDNAAGTNKLGPRLSSSGSWAQNLLLYKHRASSNLFTSSGSSSRHVLFWMKIKKN